MKAACCAIAAGLAVMAARGEVVRFTGGESADMAVAANWAAGALPGEADVAWVDFAECPGLAALTNSADLAFGGLVLTNVPNSTVVVGTNAAAGAATTLTLGADGLTSRPALGPATNLTFRARFATAADQTWDFGLGVVVFNAAIGGSAELVVSNAQTVVHNVPPAYAGALDYRFKGWSGVARLTKPGVWAQDFRWSGSGRLELTFTDTLDWKSVFPGGEVKLNGGSYLLLTQPGAPKVAFGDGDVFTNGTFVVDSGEFRQSGGHVSANLAQVGFSKYDTLYELTGGRFDAQTFYMGNGSTTWYANPKFVLDGGDAGFGALWLGDRGGEQLVCHDFTVKSGTLAVAETCPSQPGDDGLILAFGRCDPGMVRSSPSTAYHQSGGTVSVPRVALAGATTFAENRRIAVTNSYSTFTLSGGLFEVGSHGFSATQGRWNVGATTDSWYRVELQGGTLAATDDSFSELDTIVPSGAEATIDTRNSRFAMRAPLKGSGALAKKGAGTLILADASAFNGELSVKEGAVKLSGAPLAAAAVAPAAGCVVWRAEDAVAGLSDGDEVATWPDATASRIAVAPTFESNPTTVPKASLDEFNGRPGVLFDHSALKVAAADNPLAGQTNWTLCVVFKTSTKGVGWNTSWYKETGIVGREQAGIVNDWALVIGENGYVGAGLGVAKFNNDHSVYTKSRSYVDGQPHVAIYSMDGDGHIILSVDGETVEKTVPLDEETHNPRNAVDIYFGVQNIADGGAPYEYAFSGAMAEIRFYPGTTLTWNEKAAVGAELAAKYGASQAVATIGNMDDGPSLGDVLPVAEAAAPAIPDDGAAAWDADSILSVADGAEVTEWPSTDGTRKANKANVTRMTDGSSLASTSYASTWNGPVLRKGAINGHNAVYFSGYKTALGIPPEDSPVSGATAWTAAVVFRTRTDGMMPDPKTMNRNFFASSAMLGAELPNNDRADWAVGLWGEGNRIMAGYGGKNVNPRGDQSTVSRVWDLADGETHCAVCSFDTATGLMRIVVDGVFTRTYLQRAGSGGTPRETMRVLIGSANCDYNYTGELAAVRLYDSFIDDAAVKALTDAWVAKYGILTPSQFPHSNDSGAYGLAATNVTVAAGASLVLPSTTNQPFALAAGQRLSASGSVRGTLGVAAGGVFDMASATPEALDDLWLRPGGVLRASFSQTSPVPLAKFKGEKGAIVQMTDRPAKLPPKFPLFTYSGDEPDAADMACSVSGAAPNSALVFENGRISVVTAVGTLLILR